MPLSVTTTEGRTIGQYPLPEHDLPVEVYLKIRVDEPDDAVAWCRQATAALAEVTLGELATYGHRFVIWGPRASVTGLERGNYAGVFIRGCSAQPILEPAPSDAGVQLLWRQL